MAIALFGVLMVIGIIVLNSYVNCFRNVTFILILDKLSEYLAFSLQIFRHFLLNSSSFKTFPPSFSSKTSNIKKRPWPLVTVWDETVTESIQNWKNNCIFILITIIIQNNFYFWSETKNEMFRLFLFVNLNDFLLFEECK